MNIHVPQTYESVSELKNISEVAQQIVGPKNGAPVMGIVQDGLLGIALLTSKDTFLNREEALNLLMWIDKNDTEFNCLPLPAIISPNELWTGKQIISLLLPADASAVTYKCKENGFIKETNVIIRNGELLSGILGK